MNRFFLFAMLALGLAACQTPATEPAEPTTTPVTNASDPATDRAAVEALTASYQAADRAGDHAAIASLYADDAVIHPANMPSARGRENLNAYFAANDSEPQDITFTTQDVVVSEAGDMAYEVGTIAGPEWSGKYLTVYRKTDGGWLIVGDSWSNDALPIASKDS